MRGRSRFAVLDIRNTAIVTVTVGAILGVLVSISSVGAGAVGITALIILYPQLPMARIIGSDIAHAVPLTLIAGVGHWIIGTVDWHIIGSLLAGSLPGIILGSYLTVRVPEPALRVLLAATLILVAGSECCWLRPLSLLPVSSPTITSRAVRRCSPPSRGARRIKKPRYLRA